MRDPKEETLDQAAARVAKSRSCPREHRREPPRETNGEPSASVYVVTRINAKGHGFPEVHAGEERAWARFKEMQSDARLNGNPAPAFASRAVLT